MNDHKIHIVAYKGTSMIARLIKYWTRSEYSHVEVLRFNPENPTKLTSTIGAINFKGVMWWDINNRAKGTPYEIYEVTCTKKQYKLFWSYIFAQMGKSYDLKGVFGYVSKKVHEDPKKFYCSELIYKALLHAGLNFWNREMEYISPDRLITQDEVNLIKKGNV